jgi:transposase
LAEFAVLQILIAGLPPCLIGMEACSGAHHCAREFTAFGHTVRVMAPKFVAPYRMSGKRGKRGKNYAADAAACDRRLTGNHANRRSADARLSQRQLMADCRQPTHKRQREN